MARDTLIAVALAAGASSTVAHGLEEAPNFILPDRSTPIVVDAVTATSITFRNPSASASSANFIARAEHSLVTGTRPQTIWAGDAGVDARTAAIERWRLNRVEGFVYSAPTSASTQGSGAVAFVGKANWTAGIARVNGAIGEFAAGVSGGVADLLVATPTLAEGQSVVGALTLIEYVLGGVPMLNKMTVWGAPATTGQQIAPTDAEIRAQITNTTGPFLIGLGATYVFPGYVRVAQVTFNRTGDTTITQSVSNTWRDF